MGKGQSGSMENFHKAFIDRFKIMADRKAQGQRIAGLLCNYVPEEIFHALGIYPIRIFGGAQETIKANSYLYSNNCTFVRNCLELALEGHYDNLDILVSFNTCDHIRRLFDVWKHYLPLPHAIILSLPYKRGERSLTFYQRELLRLVGVLKDFFNLTLTNDALKQSIHLYNETRTLLKRIYGLRKKDNPPIGGSEVLQLILAAQVMPREEYNQLLRDLIKDLEGQRGNSADKIRLLIMGSELEDPAYIRLIEDLGGLVVADDLCNGMRYFDGLVEESNHPLEAIARRYLYKLPCPRIRPSADRVTQLQNIAEEYKIRGVIYQSIKFCDLHSGVFPVIRDGFKEIGVPVLALQREYISGGLGQMKTRLQAFYENIEEDRNND